MNFFSANKPLAFNYLFAFQFYLTKVFLVNDYILSRFVLISFNNIFRVECLTRYLIFLFIAYGIMALLRKKVKTNRLTRVNRIVNPNGDCDQRKLDVSFPDCSHNIVLD